MLARCVAGVPLAPGERVLYFQPADLGSSRAVFVILGVLFSVVVLGLYFFYRAIAFDTKEEHYYVVTNLRVFTVNKRGRVMKQVEVPKIWRVRRLLGGKNHLEVSAGAINDEITFRGEEKQNLAELERLMPLVRDGSAAMTLPEAPFPS